ncbi:hypothetical protein [Mucilaginibacter terrae]|uniref:TolC family protein n=1 Tax=Mucilaginibacter terrae TaxID=1955052 RepID=A0ABU3GNB8_9SPHI|nr:hypothetical protein [Mucilaginibacter terrae]MDT3401280.1 hypothetical protein [Mucilaginibacter terrae]
MRNHFNLLLILLLLQQVAHAQQMVKDDAMIYQQQRMVFQQWDQNKFTPKPGFLSLNPYYWLTWGLFHPNYHKTDRRPLSATGPQTQRLALVGTMNSIDGRYKLQSDTVRNTALSEIANHSEMITAADPLWQLYYSQQLRPVLNFSVASILAGLPPAVSAKVSEEGLLNWYISELEMLRERVQAAHSTDMDRGARIMSYHRLLLEYRKLAAVWAIRTSSAQATIEMTRQQKRLKDGVSTLTGWTPQTDVQIARNVLTRVQ